MTLFFLLFRPLSSFLTGSCDTFESDDSLVTLIVVGVNGLAKEFAQGAEVSPLNLRAGGDNPHQGLKIIEGKELPLH